MKLPKNTEVPEEVFILPRAMLVELAFLSKKAAIKCTYQANPTNTQKALHIEMRKVKRSSINNSNDVAQGTAR